MLVFVIIIDFFILGLFLLALWGYISGEDFGAVTTLFAVFFIIMTFVTVDTYTDRQFKNHKQTVYERPNIEYIKQYDNKIIYYINDELHEYKEHKYFDSNNIWIKKEYYKDETNIDIVYGSKK